MVTLLRVLLVLQEKVFVRAIGGERDGSDSESWETGLESVPPGEGAGVAPCLTVLRVVSSLFVG